MNGKEILEKAFRCANDLVKRNKTPKFLESITKEDVDCLIKNIGGNKSIVSALVTSLLKKSINPEQDIRLHRKGFEKGYDARTLDRKVTTPFFKTHFPRYANKETAFTDGTVRKNIKWTKSEIENLTLKSRPLKESFLNILDQVQTSGKNPEIYIVYIFIKLIKLSESDAKLFQISENFYQETDFSLNIYLVLEMLTKHFAEKQSSRLPVIAIYSIYEMLLPKLDRYLNKRLLPLQVHTSSDKHGFGDIEIYDNRESPFEIIEIKHKIAIDEELISDIVKKTKGIEINRYYILTTYQNGFANPEGEKAVTEYILQIKRLNNLDIIANGIISTLKYYLRFVDDYTEFIETYTKNLIADAKNSTEVKSFHLEKWNEILKTYKIENK